MGKISHLDFLGFNEKYDKGRLLIYPAFKVIRSKSLMIKGSNFYAIWDENNKKWTTDEYEAIKIIDDEVIKYTNEKFGDAAIPQLLVNADNCAIDKWKKYCQKQAIDNFKPLDGKLIFANMEKTKENYSTKQLSYPLEKGKHDGWDRLLSVLYSPEEAHKIEWIIGSIVSGDSKKIQKFAVLYGAAGTGKSTILNIIQMLFDGYYAIFDAKSLASNGNQFALDAFRSNPLVAIQHDGDLSKIEDNTRINSLVSHEEMTINEKFKSSYTSSFKAFLLMGTNKPVKITDAKSGLIRRLIDITPTGNKLSVDEYNNIMEHIPFELNGIAYHCLEVYNEDKKYYDGYVPVEMLGSTNDFYNFVSDNYLTFSREKDVPLSLAWEMYKNYCEDSNMPFPLSKRVFKDELKNYFEEFKDRYITQDGKRCRSYYIGFIDDKFMSLQYEDVKENIVTESGWIKFDKTISLLDSDCKDCKAQLTNKDGNPLYKWDNVKTNLKDIDTSKLHFVKVPLNHIVIDFDIPDKDGNKNLELNLKAASKFPPTYAELSKSGAGIHLHYLYTGDADKLSRVYDEHVEIKVFVGNSSLRRKLTKCNDLDIATISSGLPIKEERRKMVGKEIIKNEKMLRNMIIRNLKKEYHSATKPSIDFIDKLLNDAYTSGMNYDVNDLRPSIISFAASSTNQSQHCLKIASNMKYKSEETSEHVESDKDNIVFFDIEIFPNLFLVNWKFAGENNKVFRMINPTPVQIEELVQYKLIGFNNRRYDNHIIYAAMMGYSVEDLFELSQRIINGSPNSMFSEAYNLSYTDVYDFASAPNKKSLKKWEIELGIKHHELGLPWDKPVPKHLWTKVAEYCDDDVLATEAVFNHLHADWSTRKILAGIAEKSVNDSTNSISTKIVFGNEKNPQKEFHYRNLGLPVTSFDLTDGVYDFIKNEVGMPMDFTAWNGQKSLLPFFPGYKFEFGKSTYRGIEVGEGGYVEAEHGYHTNVALLDISSMHPSTMIDECLFGPKYTKRFKDIVDSRLAVKHKEFDKLDVLLDGKFAPYAQDENLPTALKTPINASYGLTAAGFENQFRDPRNIDNIVAKRGALFMIDLKYEVEARGFTVAHIKTDSIKIPNATKEIIDFVMEFGRKYGYNFEHEATYEKMCLVNNAVYIAKYASPEYCEETYSYIPGDNRKYGGEWGATGAQFAVPYVFKTLFSHEVITIEDMCETKSVKTAMYLDFNEKLPDVTHEESILDSYTKECIKGKITREEYDEMYNSLKTEIDKGHDYSFVGKVSAFCPVIEGVGGGLLVREAQDKLGNIKYDSVTGTKGFRWLTSEVIKELGREDIIDKRFYTNLVDDAMEAIGQYTDAEAFIQ